MAEVPKSERIFRLIRLLRENKRTAKQLSEILSSNIRSIYRDLEDIRAFGYQISCDEQSRYGLEAREAGSRIYFTLEETRLIRQYLSALPNIHPLKSSIERKLCVGSELVPLADELADKHRGIMISRINGAISEGKQIRLVRYHSNHSSTEQDRIVEPISLTEDYAILIAFEVRSQKQKTFKLARMKDVQVLNGKNTDKEPSAELDIFGFTGPEPLPVQIKLSFTAHRLLFEEYPASRAYFNPKVENEKYPYQFKYEVRDYRGIGRFLLGLPGEVVVIEPAGLKQYLREKAGLAGW
jgi:proteasome accessory factor C